MKLTRFASIAICTAAAFGILAGNPAEAQRGRRNMSTIIRNIQRDIQNTQKQLVQAQQDMVKAATQLGTAQSSYKQAQSEVAQAKKTMNERIGPKVGLPEALARLEQAQDEYEKASGTLIGNLRNDEEFQKLKEKMTESEERLAALRKDKSNAGSSKKERLATMTKEAHHARDLYHTRIDSDPAVKPYREKFLEAEGHLKEVRAKYSHESKNDSELHTAEVSFKQAKGQLEQAQAIAAVVEERVEALQGRLATDYALLGQ
jgi:chromosome segregation ATPase